MPINSKYLFVASMDVDPDKEALFNEVYDTEHVPNLLKVPGVHAVARVEGEPFVISIGGEEKRIERSGPRYSALYEIDDPHVLVSLEWAKAGALAQRGETVHPQPAAYALQTSLAALLSPANSCNARETGHQKASQWISV
jgi:hypothetical protein